jgi:cellulose synthase (UDP-forming)
VLQGQRFQSYRIGSDVYRVGTLSLWIRWNLLFSEYPWLVALTTIGIAFLIAILVRAMLRRHARTRLLGTE